MPRREPVAAAARPALGYLRVSTEDQARDDRASLAQQDAAIRALAARRGYDLQRSFTDPGASGGSANRPAFQALLAYCGAHPQPATAPGYVLVLNDSRWGRFEKPEEATYWRHHLDRLGWLVRFAEGDDTEDALARGVLRAIHSSTASAYREQVKATAKRGARGSAAAGYWLNEAPIGYRRREISADGTWGRTLERGQRKSDDLRVKLTPGPRKEVELILWLYRTYVAGEVGLWQLARQAARRWPEKRWSSTAVRAILTNRAYRGEVVWCRRPHDAEERRQTPVRDRETWVEVADAHPAIIPADLFAAVQARLATHVRPTMERTPYLLTGLLRCAHCGDVFGAGGSTPSSRKGPGPRSRFYLHRQGGWMPERRDPKIAACPELFMTLNQTKVETAVLEAVSSAVRQPGVRLAVSQAFDAAIAAHRETAAPAQDTLRRRRAQLQAERARLVDAVGDGTISKTDARPRLERNAHELESVDAELQRGRFGDRRTEGVAARRSEVLTAIEDLSGALASGSVADRRRALTFWLQSATVDRSDGRLRLALLPLPALVGSPRPALETGGRPGPASQLQSPPPLLEVALTLPPPKRHRA